MVLSLPIRTFLLCLVGFHDSGLLSTLGSLGLRGALASPYSLQHRLLQPSYGAEKAGLGEVNVIGERTKRDGSDQLWARSFLANLFGRLTNGGVKAKKVTKKDLRSGMLMDYEEDYYDQYGDYYDGKDYLPRRMDGNLQGVRNGGTRLSITNNLDVLRSQLRNALRRKHQRFENGEINTQRPGLHTLG